MGINGELINIVEKPNYNFNVNTGFYVMEPKILKLIPKNTKYDMVEIIKKAKKNKIKVGVFPTTEKSWADFGQWPEYFKNTNIQVNK
jgi:NDP-sugar pyrophosphorylase family protein